MRPTPEHCSDDTINQLVDFNTMPYPQSQRTLNCLVALDPECHEILAEMDPAERLEWAPRRLAYILNERRAEATTRDEYVFHYFAVFGIPLHCRMYRSERARAHRLRAGVGLNDAEYLKTFGYGRQSGSMYLPGGSIFDDRQFVEYTRSVSYSNYSIDNP